MGLHSILKRQFVTECRELLTQNEDTESQELEPTRAELALKRHKTRKVQGSCCSEQSFSENKVRYIPVKEKASWVPHAAMEGAQYAGLTSEYTTHEDALRQVE